MEEFLLLEAGTNIASKPEIIGITTALEIAMIILILTTLYFLLRGLGVEA